MKFFKTPSPYILFALLIAQFLATAMVQNVWAQESSLSQTEKAAFAFHKLTNQTPQFQKLIEQTPLFKNEESMFERQQIFDREILRLKQEFKEFEPSENYLSINTDINLQLRTDSKTPTLNFKFTNSQAAETPYFPYPFGEEWIAAIAQNLNKFAALPLTKAQYKKVRGVFEFRKIYDGELNLELRPIAAKASQPLIIEGAAQWPLLTDIALLEFVYLNPKTQQKETLVSYKADWHRTETVTQNID